MFGIGFGEFAVILLVLLIAVGPKSMPKLMQGVGRGLREFRKATRELRSQVGIDELMRDEVLRDPIGAASLTAVKKPTFQHGFYQLTDADLDREAPPEGADVRHAREMAARREKLAVKAETANAAPAAEPESEVEAEAES